MSRHAGGAPAWKVPSWVEAWTSAALAIGLGLVLGNFLGWGRDARLQANVGVVEGLSEAWQRYVVPVWRRCAAAVRPQMVPNPVVPNPVPVSAPAGGTDSAVDSAVSGVDAAARFNDAVTTQQRALREEAFDRQSAGVDATGAEAAGATPAASGDAGSDAARSVHSSKHDKHDKHDADKGEPCAGCAGTEEAERGSSEQGVGVAAAAQGAGRAAGYAAQARSRGQLPRPTDG